MTNRPDRRFSPDTTFRVLSRVIYFPPFASRGTAGVENVNNSKGLLSPGPIATPVSGRYAAPHHQVRSARHDTTPTTTVYQTGLPSPWPPSPRITKTINIVCLLMGFFLFSPLFHSSRSPSFPLFFFATLDHIELDAQVPAPVPSSQSQRHHQTAVLDFPHVRVQRNRVHRRDGLPKRKGAYPSCALPIRLVFHADVPAE